MAKEDLFSKLKLKDYNNELEKIIEKKDYSEDVKNLLLSMLYKIETGYDDYVKVKRDVSSKKEIIEEVIKDIDYNCYKINLIKPMSEESKILEKKGIHSTIDMETGIIATYPNEKDMLKAIYQVSEKKIEIQEKYGILKTAITEFLQIGYIIDSLEIIRDFNGWSWYTAPGELENFSYNLLFQNIRILIGNAFLREWIKNEEYIIDYIDNFQNELEKRNGQELAIQFLEKWYQTLLHLSIQNKEEEKQKILEQKRKIEEELKKIENKASYLEEISRKKKEILKKINYLDETINSKEALTKEFTRRNEMTETDRIFSISHLVEILAKERKDCIDKVKEYSEIMDPKKYLKNLEKKKEELTFINSLKIEEPIQEEQDLIAVQKLFIDCFNNFIQKIEFKKDMIELIYELRYYELILFNNKKYIKDVKELKDKLEKTEEMVIQKAITLKVLEPITQDEILNTKILKNIFKLRVLELENLELKMNKKDNTTMEVEFIDGESIETTITIKEKEFTKAQNIRWKKKVKLFA